jgi:hypothetical protein
MLYAGTNKPLSRKDWNKDVPDLCVKSLDDREAAIVTHFSLPEVQLIGSTSGCGCDFPHVTLTGNRGGYSEVDVDDPEWEASERMNREALVALLHESGEETVELYGIWLSNDKSFAGPIRVKEEIPIARILDPAFRFKEWGFYLVRL